eukprot:scaffold87_cov388-Prasinococcus_capsulatus_cf.AAC.20
MDEKTVRLSKLAANVNAATFSRTRAYPTTLQATHHDSSGSHAALDQHTDQVRNQEVHAAGHRARARGALPAAAALGSRTLLPHAPPLWPGPQLAARHLFSRARQLLASPRGGRRGRCQRGRAENPCTESCINVARHIPPRGPATRAPLTRGPWSRGAWAGA